MLVATARAASRRGSLPHVAAFASSSTDIPPDAVSTAAHAVAASTSSTLTGPRPIPAGPPATALASREIQVGSQAFKGDLRSMSALGLGDGITSHTAKWLQADAPAAGVTVSPADFIAASPPIKVHGAVVASTGVDGDPALGCPVEYIDVSGRGVCAGREGRSGVERERGLVRAPFFLHSTFTTSPRPPFFNHTAPRHLRRQAGRVQVHGLALLFGRLGERALERRKRRGPV
jgi:hypothetical protein